MKTRFSEDKLRPFIIQLFKPIWQFRVVSTVGNGNGWLNKKPVVKEFDVITYPVGVENLKTIVHFTAFIIHKILQRRHHIKFGI